jgi:hypothetical protein
MKTEDTTIKTSKKNENRTVTILFKFIGAENGTVLVGTKQPFKGMVYTSKVHQRIEATMPIRRFTVSQYGDDLRVLTDDQIDLFLQENIDLYTRSDVENMFTFFLERGQAGHVYLTQEQSDSIGTTTETINHNFTVVAQMVRFGFLNKVKLQK